MYSTFQQLSTIYHMLYVPAHISGAEGTRENLIAFGLGSVGGGGRGSVWDTCTGGGGWGIGAG